MNEVDRTKDDLAQALDARAKARLRAICEVDRMFAPIIARRMGEHDAACHRASLADEWAASNIAARY